MREEDAARAERFRGDLLPATLALGLPVAVYDLLLVERRYALVLGGAFLREPLTAAEKVLFALLAPAEVLVLLLTTAALLRWLLRRAFPRRGWTSVAALLAASAYFAAVTVQFEVYRYFKDSLDLNLARDLGGGSLGGAIAFVKAEIAALSPFAIAALAAAVIWLWGWFRYATRISAWLGRIRGARWLVSPKGLLVANAAMLLVPAAALACSPPLARALRHSAAHEVYALALAYGSDVDGDGWGLLSRPVDHAPFDAARHPYALDLPGNGVDENGIGGDLSVAARRARMPPWDGNRLARRNVLVVVLETARSDLLDAEESGEPVMPHLQGLGGQRLRVISHMGFTGPSVCGVLNGTIAPEEPGTSLVDRFRGLGYAIGIFSGQPEDFSGIAERTGMDRADARWDAARFPPERRMYGGTDLGSLVMPGDLVVGKFEEWIHGLDRNRRFFAYLNLQEMHFPYNSDAIPAVLVERKIPRGRIAPGNRDWVRHTYRNAAREADRVLGRAIDALRARGIFEETLVFVVGDHGEELFDHGYLGHGVDLSHEQNETLGVLVNGTVEPPPGPIGISDVGAVIHNALLAGPEGRLHLGGPVLAMVGGLRAPRQVGLFDGNGLRRYDFVKGAWSRQDGFGAAFRPMEEDAEVIHAWESYALEICGR